MLSRTEPRGSERRFHKGRAYGFERHRRLVEQSWATDVEWDANSTTANLVAEFARIQIEVPSEFWRIQLRMDRRCAVVIDIPVEDCGSSQRNGRESRMVAASRRACETFVEHVFNVLEFLENWHVENVPHETAFSELIDVQAVVSEHSRKTLLSNSAQLPLPRLPISRYRPVPACGSF